MSASTSSRSVRTTAVTDSPGQKRFASNSLMIATGAGSVSLKNRPARSAAPLAAKYPGVTLWISATGLCKATAAMSLSVT